MSVDTIWDKYERRLKIDGSTTKDRQIDAIKRNITNNFKDNPSWKEVYINGSTTITNVSIVEESVLVKQQNKKIMLSMPDETFDVGDVVNWDSNNWIVTSVDDDKTVETIGAIEKSTVILNYYKNNVLFSVPAVVYSGTESIEENKYMFLTADELLLKCPYNVDTAYIKEGIRFLLSGTAYKVIATNDVLEQGLLRIRIKEDVIDMTDDNLTLSIANYYSNQNTYTLSLLSNSTLNLNTSLETSQINIKAYNNNVLVSSPVVTYVSSDPTKASVSSTGLITCHATGIATITVTYQSQTVTITVTGVTSSEYSYKINIIGLDTIKVGREETYSGLFLDEGVVSANTFTWLLTATDGIASTDLATILSSTSTSCILKTNLIPKYGEIKLKCTTTDTNYTTTKTIKIISTI